MKTIKFTKSEENDPRFASKLIEAEGCSYECYSNDGGNIRDGIWYGNCFFFVSLGNIEKETKLILKDAHFNRCGFSMINDVEFTHCEFDKESRFNCCDEVKLNDCLVYETRFSGAGSTCFSSNSHFCGSHVNDIHTFSSTDSYVSSSQFRNTEVIFQNSEAVNNLFSNVDLYRLAESSFERCRFLDSDFKSYRVFKTKFKNSIMVDCVSNDAHFIKTDFEEMKLDFCSFEKTEFKNVTFRECSFNEVTFDGCHFENVEINADGISFEELMSDSFITNCTGELSFKNQNGVYCVTFLQHAENEITDMQDYEIVFMNQAGSQC